MMIKSVSWIATSTLLAATLGGCSSVEADTESSSTSGVQTAGGTGGAVSAPPTTATASGTQGDTMGTTGSSGSDTDDPSTTGVETTGPSSATEPGTTTTDPTSGSSSGVPETGSTTTGDVETVTIYDIQQGNVELNDVVTVDDAIVTAIAVNGFWAQAEAGGEFSGIFVFSGKDGPDISGLALGDELVLTGAYEEFFELTELNITDGAIEITASPGEGNVPAAEVVPVADIGESWESVFVRVEETAPAVLTVTEVNPMMDINEFTVEDSNADTVVIDDFIYDAIDDGVLVEPDATFESIQGPVNFGFGAFKITPRAATDITGFNPA